MRTTIDLPDSLFRSVKLRATEQGMTLKEFVIMGMEAALKVPESSKHRMTKAPIRRSAGAATIPPRSNRELAELLEASGEIKF